MARVMEIVTPLGADVLLFHRMHARDEISRLSEYEIDLLSKQADIDLDKILAQKVTVKLELPAGKTRFFNGFVTRFVQVGMHGRYHLYRATVRPWLWFLTRTANCRIFQEMDVPDIVKKVFDTYAIADIKLELTETYAKREYCVQYRETDFNFVSRLLEDEGIYYFFRHVDGRHTMVLVDSYSGHTPFEGYAQIPFIPLERSTRLEKEFVYDWKLKREVQSGRFALDDFDFKKPSSDLQVKTTAKRNHDQADHEIFDYPGEYFKTGEGDRFVRARIDELQTQFELVSAQGNARGASVGSVFKLGGHPRGDQNREYLVLSSKYELEYTQYEAMENTGAKCSCHFTALDSKQQFRPQRTSGKTFVQGPQTAIVVGPAGDEIYTDEYGRVKVQFHWDRYGKNDENSSCWARVSHPWAGNNWGMIAIPRIGQEVIVDFLEGDPDRPLITGRVYNAEQMPPWELPANKTQTGVLTRSSLGGSAANANAIRFEDKKGDEQLWIHAEKNQDIEVENDETHWVGHDRKKTIDHDETTLVQHDRTETVGNNETITIGVDRTETVGRNETITVALMRTRAVGVNEAIAIGAAQEVVVGATRTLAVGIDQSTSIGNNHSVEVGSDQSSSIGDNRSSTVGKDDSLKVGKNLVIDAGDSVTIKTGSASITMKKDGTITIKGKDITINGSGKINVKASSDVVIKGAKILQN